MSGATIGQYRVTGLIGKGGMGAVYAAEHMLLGRPAAVKVLLPEMSSNQEIVTRFFNEARAATAIRHPGIVEIYDFGFHADGSAYIVMEKLEGEPLAARMARGRVPVATALGVVRQIAGALAAAHAKGIVHRDLKPENVFLVRDPEVPGGERIKLLDFGIAKLAGEAPNGQKTRTGQVMGTPTYMAPEQCRGVAVDSRADVYSLGCILFELVTGHPPFVGEGVGDVLAAHIHVPPPAVSSLVPGVAPAIERLVQMMLVKDPRQRMQRVEEVIEAVEQLGGGVSFRAATPDPSYAAMPVHAQSTTLSSASGAHRSGAPAPARNRGVVIGAVAGVAVLAVVVALLLLPDDDEERALPAVPVAAVTPPAEAAPPPTPAISVPAPVAPAPSAPPPVAAPAVPDAIELMIDSTPPGATVLLGKRELGKTPYQGTLPKDTGNVTLVLRRRGHVDARVVVPTDAPFRRTVILERKKDPAPGPRPSTDTRDQSQNPY